jgi:hypothetical protein
VRCWVGDDFDFDAAAATGMASKRGLDNNEATKWPVCWFWVLGDDKDEADVLVISKQLATAASTSLIHPGYSTTTIARTITKTDRHNTASTSPAHCKRSKMDSSAITPNLFPVEHRFAFPRRILDTFQAWNNIAG